MSATGDTGPGAPAKPWPPVGLRTAPTPPPVGPVGNDRRDRTAWVRPVAFPLVVAVSGVAAASATRLVDGWEDGRVWALDVALVAVAGLFGLKGLVRGVSAVGDEWRHGAPVPVLAARVAAVALVALAVGAVGIRGGVDWEELDVPAAWRRLELDLPEQDPLPAWADADADAVEAAAEVSGLCFAGRELDERDEVPCSEPHRGIL